MYAVFSLIFLHFSAYLTILCSYCTIILYMGRMHQLYKIFFSSYSDLYYKTRSLGNLLLSVNYYPNFIIISNIIHVPINYLYLLYMGRVCYVPSCMCRVCMGRVCYVPSLLWAELTRHRRDLLPKGAPYY